VFENRVLRRIYGGQREAIIGSWGKLHNEDLHNLYSPNIIRIMKMRWAWHVTRMREKMNP
jgi:hypothetical protein